MGGLRRLEKARLLASHVALAVQSLGTELLVLGKYRVCARSTPHVRPGSFLYPLFDLNCVRETWINYGGEIRTKEIFNFFLIVWINYKKRKRNIISHKKMKNDYNTLIFLKRKFLTKKY